MKRVPVQWNLDVGILEGHLDEDARWRRPDLPPGSAAWERDLTGKTTTGIDFVCPCGCGDVVSIPVEGQSKWNWDGNESAPTLTPSIKRLCRCGWHGFLTKGIFETC